jgi:chromate transporter
MMMVVWDLFWGFVKVGLLGYGGGPGSISLIQVVAVDSYHWLDNTQFAEILAIGNALPGPIATKMAASIGWRTAGPFGALAALLGVVLPSLVLMLGLYQLLLAWRSNPYIEGLIQGVKPIVLVLLVGLVLDFIPLTIPKGTRATVLTAAFFVAGFLAIRWLRVSPVWVIVGSMAAGALLLRG